jgi:hypothetical protein
VTAELMPRKFSTAGLPAERRVELWESHNSAALIGLAVHAPGPLDATELNIALPQARHPRRWVVVSWCGSWASDLAREQAKRAP